LTDCGCADAVHAKQASHEFPSKCSTRHRKKFTVRVSTPPFIVKAIN
jgi:hypothetical protein